MSDATADGGRIVVLVVEDDPLQRMDAATIIEEAGYEVVEASNADQAIAILEARPEIRIVFTDIEMPGSMDGVRLARAIRDRWPPVELILTSGRYQLATHEIPVRGRFLPKPYNPNFLVEAIRHFTA